MNEQELILSKMNSSSTLNEWQEFFKTIFKLRKFDDETVEKKLILLIEEIGELAKAIRKEKSQMAIDYKRISEYESVVGELADVFIVLISMCNVENIDLNAAVIKKEKINTVRSWTK